jgi:F0F1-type ATP synthase assembly protein I
MKVRHDKNEVSDNLKLYSKYSSIAVQMLSIILIGVFGGIKLDQWIGWEFPIFTVVLSISAVLFAIYIVIKDLLKKNKSNQNMK